MAKTKKSKRVMEKIVSTRLSFLNMKEVEEGFVIQGIIEKVITKEAHGKFAEQKQIVLKDEQTEKLTALPSHFTINDVLLGKKDEEEFVGEYVELCYVGQTEANGKKKGVHLWNVSKEV